jgi:ATP-binding cassette subfamily B protein
VLAGMIVDQVIRQGHVDRLARLCVLMIVLTVVRVFSRYGYQMWMERFGQNSIYRLVSDEYEKLHELDFTYFNHTRTGDIMSRMTSDTDAIRHFLSWVSYQVTDSVVMFVGALCVMFALDWRLALALACVTPLLFVLTRALAGHARPLFLAIRNSLADMNSMVEENIEGNRVVKAFVREPHETRKFDERNDDYMQRNMDLAMNSRKYMPWLDGLGFALQLITLGFGGLLVMRGSMTLGSLVAFNSFLWMIDGPVRYSGWLINDWQRFNASCVKIRRLLTAESRITEHADAHESTKRASAVRIGVDGKRPATPDRISGEIRFEHVSFAFPDDPDTPVLQDLDFFVPAGSKLGILGETGAGKSTLVSLISRFYDPTSGRVLVDGIDARDWPLAMLRSQVNIVAQDTFLFSDTIGSNIGFGARGGRDDRFIQHMANIAGADEFIRSMPEGYETIVGERGVGLVRRAEAALEPSPRLGRRSGDSDHGRHHLGRRYGDRGRDPAAPARAGCRQDHRDHRSSHLVGQGRRPDPRLGAWAHHRARHARGARRGARTLLGDLSQAAGPAIRPAAGLQRVGKGRISWRNATPIARTKNSKSRSTCTTLCASAGI